jgi:hypothetical protein
MGRKCKEMNTQVKITQAQPTHELGQQHKIITYFKCTLGENRKIISE